jgi:hypothetical protein
MQHNFLPIAKRELRAAARHRNTHRLRWATCALAVVISVIWFVSNPKSAMPAKFVGSAFALQTVYAFGFVTYAMDGDEVFRRLFKGSLARPAFQ